MFDAIPVTDTPPQATLAFTFPGQGSHSLGMLKELADHAEEVEETFAEASRILKYDLWSLVQNGPEAELELTHKNQPALVAAGVAIWRVWHRLGGPEPALLAGHSLGEYTALVCANALSFEDAIALVAERGRLMQEAVPHGLGAMAAILGLEDEQVEALCDACAQGDVVSAVNYNAPGQVVVAGIKEAVKRTTEAAKKAGAKRVVTLPISVPSHCSLMKPAAERLAECLEQTAIITPRIPVLHNVDVAFKREPGALRDALVRQLYNPVRWVETIQTLAGRGARILVECGPGKVLTGLNKRIVGAMTALPLLDPASLEHALVQARAG